MRPGWLWRTRPLEPRRCLLCGASRSRRSRAARQAPGRHLVGHGGLRRATHGIGRALDLAAIGFAFSGNPARGAHGAEQSDGAVGRSSVSVGRLRPRPNSRTVGPSGRTRVRPWDLGKSGRAGTVSSQGSSTSSSLWIPLAVTAPEAVRASDRFPVPIPPSAGSLSGRRRSPWLAASECSSAGVERPSPPRIPP